MKKIFLKSMSKFYRLDSRLRGNDRGGFTLVETLVAISILMLSVTGPLYFASESLKAATYAKDQISAFYLAQDAFEQVVKIRNTNVYKNADRDWKNGLTGCENTTTLCVIDLDSHLRTVSAEDETFLYIDDNGFYSHTSSGGTKTIFKRTIQIVPTNGDGGSWTKATEMKVTVKMTWNNHGAKSFEAYEFLRYLNNPN